MLTMSTLLKPQNSFHHGDLTHALISAGLKQVEKQGMESLGLRQLAMTTGVSPAAVYRHFSDLLHLKASISKACREKMARMMISEMNHVKDSGSKNLEIQRFKVCGRTYIYFGINHPKLFEIAFTSFDSPELGPDEPSPWVLLNDCLSRLYKLDLISAENLEKAPIIAWSAVHGFAGLASQRMIENKNIAISQSEVVLDTILKSLEIRT